MIAIKMKTKPEMIFVVVVALVAATIVAPQLVLTQDILRHPQVQQQQQANNNLANIQLPPQLASLTPQQLHQLARLRELQIQQQQQQQQDAPAPIGSEQLLSPTAQPANSNQQQSQIPQPLSANSQTTTASSSRESSADNNDRHDDGSYNESGSEMEGVLQMGAAAASGATPSGDQAGGGQTAAAAAVQATPTFEVNWNKCPQLEPSESEKNKKTQVITKCLQSAPIPANLTRENVEAHREQIATCALKIEGWFDDGGNYRYDKAESEIRGKRLEPSIEIQVLKFHVACKDEAGKKFPREQNRLIDQVQFYQACMDYYISIVCEIEVSVDQ